MHGRASEIRHVLAARERDYRAVDGGRGDHHHGLMRQQQREREGDTRAQRDSRLIKQREEAEKDKKKCHQKRVFFWTSVATSTMMAIMGGLISLFK